MALKHGYRFVCSALALLFEIYLLAQSLMSMYRTDTSIRRACTEMRSKWAMRFEKPWLPPPAPRIKIFSQNPSEVTYG